MCHLYTQGHRKDCIVSMEITLVIAKHGFITIRTSEWVHIHWNKSGSWWFEHAHSTPDGWTIQSENLSMKAERCQPPF